MEKDLLYNGSIKNTIMKDGGGPFSFKSRPAPRLTPHFHGAPKKYTKPIRLGQPKKLEVKKPMVQPKKTFTQKVKNTFKSILNK